MEITMSTNDVNNFSVSELNYIRDAVENMNKFNQIEILRILNNHKDVTINENKYGIHINLSDLKKELLDELNVYIKYVNTQEVALHQVEKEKETYKNTYFTKDIKDKNKIK
jgi:NTP pyrophosphatase (non-canonical NTP hydrolase)